MRQLVQLLLREIWASQILEMPGLVLEVVEDRCHQGEYLVQGGYSWEVAVVIHVNLVVEEVTLDHDLKVCIRHQWNRTLLIEREILSGWD